MKAAISDFQETGGARGCAEVRSLTARIEAGEAIAHSTLTRNVGAANL